MQVQIITPEKTLFSAEATMVVAPGVEGDFGVLPGHAPFISTLRPGVIIVDTADGQQRKIAVADGFAEANPEHCIILAETAVDVEGITAAQAEARLDEARKFLETIENDEHRTAAEKKLLLAEAVATAI